MTLTDITHRQDAGQRIAKTSKVNTIVLLYSLSKAPFAGILLVFDHQEQV